MKVQLLNSVENIVAKAVMFSSHLLQMCCKWKTVNPFPHTTILNIFCQKMENLYN